MTNLLPPLAKKKVRREYLIRVVAVWLMAGAVLFSALSVLSIPTWYLLRVSESAIDSHLSAAEAAKTSYESLSQEVKAANDLIDHLRDKEPRFEPSLLVSEFDKLAGASVHITSFAFEDKQKAILIGLADTRADLSAFRDRLEKDGRFEAIDLPLSSLVRDQDASFTLTLTVKPNQP